jgi:ankyrin repeat protein
MKKLRFLLSIFILYSCTPTNVIKPSQQEVNIFLFDPSHLEEISTLYPTYLIEGFKDKQGQNLLHLAAKLGYPDIILKALTLHFPINDPDNEGNSPLMLSILYNQCGTAEILLIKGANPNQINFIGNSPLIQALLQNNGVCAEILLLYSANPYIKTPTNRSAFDLAKQSKDPFIRNLFSSFST